MGQELVLPLQEADDAKLVGGKAASLGKIIRAGFNVPDGFVITTKVFEALDKALEEDKAAVRLDKLALLLAKVDKIKPYGQTKFVGHFDYRDIKKNFPKMD